jgi:tetratricopeptide (TPR) repeat protein
LQRGEREVAARAWEALVRQNGTDHRTMHHLAVLHHSWAMELEERDHIEAAEPHWRAGLKYWYDVWRLDAYWQELGAKGSMLGRDFRVQTIDECRMELPARLLRINAEYAMYRLAQPGGGATHARRHLKYILDSSFPEQTKQEMRETIAQPLVGKAKQLAEHGDYEQAIRQFEQLLEVDGQHSQGRELAADAYNRRGVKLHSERRYGEARQSWKRALELVPDHRSARENLEQTALHAFGMMFNREGGR